MKNMPSQLTSLSPAGAADGQVVSALLRLARAVEAHLERVLATVDLSPPKFGALTHLAESAEPLTLSELATRLTCVRSNITQLVDRLEADGLVQRVEDPRDRRVVRAALTGPGRERQ